MAMIFVGPTSVWAEGIRYVAPTMCTAPLWLCVAAWGLGESDSGGQPNQVVTISSYD